VINFVSDGGTWRMSMKNGYNEATADFVLTISSEEKGFSTK
jgi:hypothetical protein